jgi:hypothetical protein
VRCDSYSRRDAWGNGLRRTTCRRFPGSR